MLVHFWQSQVSDLSPVDEKSFSKCSQQLSVCLWPYRRSKNRLSLSCCRMIRSSFTLMVYAFNFLPSLTHLWGGQAPVFSSEVINHFQKKGEHSNLYGIKTHPLATTIPNFKPAHSITEKLWGQKYTLVNRHMSKKMNTKFTTFHLFTIF